MDIHCSNVGVKAGTEYCNYCVIRKSCGALKEAKRLNKNKGDKNMKVKDVTHTTPLYSSISPMQRKPVKKNKIERVYEDDDFVIDLFTVEKIVRVSIFKDGHFKDEVFIKKEDYID